MIASVFTPGGMSAPPRSEHVARQLAGHVGAVVRGARTERRLSLRELSRRAGLSAGMVHKVESGRGASLLTYTRIAAALDLQPTFELVDPRKRARAIRGEDPVHAAMGELEAQQLTGQARTVALDEPFQHYQFAGRADVLAFDLDRRALLHLENRTRFPNIQEAFGSYNAKRQYLPAVLAQRFGLRRGWDVVTHAIVALWSAEVLHAVRLRDASFRSVCPSGWDDLREWWDGAVPEPGPPTSTLVVMDPLADIGRRSRFADLDGARRVRPRYRGYSEAWAALSAAGQA
jgi:transcriptional regulator with XRE-family HTH domain